ncbi:MAG: ABC transporter [Piscirickettsiaceae bacterium CG_4_9_14_3_um_filter_43_564]|nr:ABC transporter ATP-binding protein [Thiomicrospira sp.]PIQ03723.1 MAG: ABC transporter [Piscirickettsiaceae bacterium CG18_big_fil_WC_8_21_14_2_50_44_103]PIU39063.1 MAG: ABC transporter [Piscirickettsiaceae bacterium CG07_land_8_20_14_0_80_44_28]PIW57026.1 MAG: ABC transporter [Piscirickettsiaceae bacterium CG12_big_fil_rev_8_21_14_0_65_44_934]PIX80909.1 MAG: ABC transporter [Piscirickettsiaceae bacterium CG_4_10_14_3_um_filter_44_349]PIY76347.1 MAG: ABC transporter [Piscirickettsiaceae ba
MHTPAVSFQSVHKQYGELSALKSISFDVRPGCFFGLLGPNGAGKSTLINTMAGLVKPTSGTIQVNGHDVVKDYRQARRTLGVVPQELISDPFFSIQDLLTIQGGYFGLKGRAQAKWIDELLSRLALSDKRNALTHELSGGMKRRVLIAMALVHQPQVLVLDEPTAGVDVDLRKTLWEFTKDLHKKGHTIILTTHYLEEAEALCEEVAILKSGNLKALETTSELISRHQYRYLRVIPSATHQFLVNQLPVVLQQRYVEQDVNGVLFRLEKDMPLNSMLGWLSDAGFDVQDLTSRNATLEEVFLDLTGEVE